MKKDNFFSPSVYALTLKRLLFPFTVFTVLSGIALFFLLFFTAKNSHYYDLSAAAEKLSGFLSLLAPCAVLFPLLAFPQVKERKAADCFDSLPLTRSAVFTGCALGALTYALIAFSLLFFFFLAVLILRFDLWQAVGEKPRVLTILSAYSVLLSQVLLFSAIACLARVLCGRTVKALAVSLLTVPVIRGLFALVLLLFSPFFYDVPKSVLAFLSPANLLPPSFLPLLEDLPLFGATLEAADWFNNVRSENVLPYGVRFAYYLILAILLLVLGGLIYKKRRSEDTKKDVFPPFTAHLLPTLLLALPCGLLGAMAALPEPVPEQWDIYGMTLLQQMAGYELFFKSAKPWQIALFAGVCFVILLLIASKCRVKRLAKLLPTALPALLLGATLFLSFKTVYFHHQLEIPADKIASASFDTTISEAVDVFYQDYLRLSITESTDPAVLSGLARGIKIDLNESYSVRPVTLTLKNGLKLRRLTKIPPILSAVREDEGALIKPLDFEKIEGFTLQIAPDIKIDLTKEQGRRYLECYNHYGVTEQKAAYTADSSKPALTLWASIPVEVRIFTDGSDHLNGSNSYQTEIAYRSFRFDPPGQEAEDLLYEILYEAASSFTATDLSKVIKHTEYFLSIQNTSIAENYDGSFRLSLDLYTAKGRIERNFRPSAPNEPIGDTLDLLKLLQEESAQESEEQKEYLVFVRVDFSQSFPEQYYFSKVFPLYLSADGYAALPNASPYGDYEKGEYDVQE